MAVNDRNDHTNDDDGSTANAAPAAHSGLTDAGTAAPVHRLTPWEVVAVAAMFRGTFAVGIDSFVISPLLTEMGASLQASVGQIALGVTAYAAAYAIGAPLLSPLGDRFRSQVVAGVGLLLFAAATLTLAAQTTLAGFLVLRVVAGLGGAMWMPNVQAYLTRRYRPPLSTRPVGIVVAGLSAAIALGVPAGALAASVLSWRQTFIGIAVLAAVGAAVLLVTLGGRPGVAAGTPRRLGDYPRALVAPGPRRALLATLCWMTGFYGLYTFLGTFLQHRLGVGIAASGAYLIAYGVGNFVASMTSGWVNPRLGAPHRAIAWFGAASVLSVLLLTGLPLSPVLAIVLLLGWAVAQGYASTGLIALAASRGGDRVTTVLALNSSFIYVGTAVGAALFAVFPGPAVLALGLPSALLTIVAAVFAVRADAAA